MKKNNFIEENKVQTTKFHNLMVYEAINRILTTKEFDLQMRRLIENADLTKAKNPFFIKAKDIPHMSLETALQIAFNWQEITKQFTITVLKNLEEFAGKINQLNFSPEYVIGALQTGITILSKDLNNTLSMLEEKTTKSPDGMDSIWWEENILNPLLAATKDRSLFLNLKASPQTQQLLQEMNRLSQNPLGFVVQLYVIESISLDAILAFLPIFSKIEVEGQRIFNSSKIISWIMFHIENESVYHHQKTQGDKGMINIISSREDQKELFSLAQDYIRPAAKVEILVKM